MLRNLAFRTAERFHSVWWITLACWLGLGAAAAGAAGLEGFTEPFREIDVASAETGILESVDVREGNEVQQGQRLAQLDQEVFQAMLRIADKQKQLRGQLESSKAELRLRTDRLEKLRRLLGSRHASQEEVDRAATEQEIAQARVLTAEEELELKQLDYDRIQAQLDRRTIRSPADGIVKKVHKDAGEFVAPTDPVVLTVVQLDPLVATFAVPAEQAGQLALDGDVDIRLGPDQTAVTGTVKFVSPGVDAQSGTVTVKAEFANPDRRYRSGERCVLILTGPTAKLTRHP